MISVLAILRRAMGFAIFKSLGKFPLRESFMKRIKVPLLLAIGLAALNGTTLFAQFPYGGPTNGMSASATERVTLKPEKLRLLNDFNPEAEFPLHHLRADVDDLIIDFTEAMFLSRNATGSIFAM